MELFNGHTLNLTIAALAALVLFLFAIESFGHEIQILMREKLQQWLEKVGKKPFVGVIAGMLTTALIQSSTATSVICVSLASRGSMTFAQALPLLLGANIGTTVTTQLVAFKLTSFAPYIMIFGWGLKLARFKYNFLGKAIFYFGFLFFSLELLSGAVSPIKDQEWVLELFRSQNNPYTGILVGILITALVQSSSVTTGICVILAAQNIMPIEIGIGVIIGANVGTTVTAALAAIGQNNTAKQIALAQFLINVIGVLLFLPILPWFSTLISQTPQGHGKALANAHMIFNVSTSVVVFVFRDFLQKKVESFIQ